MFLDVKQIIDFDVMIQKENLDDQEKTIKINDLKLRGIACGGAISSRIFHDQIWIEKFLKILRRGDDPIRIEKFLTRRLVEYSKIVKWFVCLDVE